jgi:hypothetical protein
MFNEESSKIASETVICLFGEYLPIAIGGKYYESSGGTLGTERSHYM